MTGQTNFHPPQEMLEHFAHGTLSTGPSVAVSAHVELCTSCRELAGALEAEATRSWLQDPQAESVSHSQSDSQSGFQSGFQSDSQSDFAALIESIVATPQQREARRDGSAVSEIHMHECSVTLPRVLAKIASDGLVWKKLAGGINQAAVSLDDETQCEFIYMKPGSQVPIHRHQGNEITLVLEGSFSDELGAYRPSDFVLRDRSHHHQPVSEEGCLCFAVLDSPLTFTRGLARLLNPILRYRFNRATA
ncbi:MAG: ChrR family anti-sigma-E factor, partial [Pseudohongiellaceae bacterium]